MGVRERTPHPKTREDSAIRFHPPSPHGVVGRNGQCRVQTRGVRGDARPYRRPIALGAPGPVLQPWPCQSVMETLPLQVAKKLERVCGAFT